MRNLLTTGLISVSLLAVAVGAQDAKQADKADLAKIKGKWSAKVGPNADVPITIEFTDKQINVTIDAGDGNETVISGEFKIDESKSPKAIDLTGFQSGDGEKMEDNLGIYEINGDEMKICTGGPGQPRPSEFIPMEDNGRGTVVLKRLKQ